MSTEVIKNTMCTVLALHDTFAGDANSLYDQLNDLPDKVQKFHSTWYSSNIMTLAVLGKGKFLLLVLAS